ncbi:MAG: AMP-binding protein, partial [Fimbriimonadaceae bacterium]|nr:AMP-binding protein [Alphaproteobacteria bacterium]
MGQFNWEKSYPAGVIWDIDIKSRPAYAVLDEAVATYGQSVMLDFMGKTLTYSQVSEMVDRAAAGFQKLGVGPGVRVGLFLPNTPHFVIAFFGVLKAGGIVVNFSPLDAVQTLKHKIEDSGSDIIVTLNLKALYEPISKALEGRQGSRLVVGTLQ